VSFKFLQDANVWSTTSYNFRYAIDMLDCRLLIVEGKTVFLFRNRISTQMFNYFV